MINVIKQLESNIIVPVVVLNNIDDAIPVAKALYEGGIHCIEVTFRSDVAPQCISMIRNEFPQMLVGAGTILNIDQLNQAIQSDAHFIVTPGLNEKIIIEAQNRNIPIIPGVSSATDCDKAINHNISYVKFFPSEQLGGLGMIKALSGPYKMLKFMPTGGITLGILSDYLKRKIHFCDRWKLAC
jgi:Entner-Doudoroff aldolase